MQPDTRKSREDLLKMYNEGLDFFLKEYPAFWLKVRYDQYVELDSPFHSKKRTLSIYYNKKSRKWFFKDHIPNGHFGDMFNYVGFKYKLDFRRDFKRIVGIIQDEMKDYKRPNFNTYKLLNNATGEYIQFFK